jgi:hypothetical protein
VTQIFLTGGGQYSFPDPGNWNPTNLVECLGSGGNGRIGEKIGAPTSAGGGGGGGAYAFRNNVVLPFPVSYYVFPQGASADNYWCSFGNSSPNNAPTDPNAVGATCGTMALQGNAAGTGATGRWPSSNGANGGNGGNGGGGAGAGGGGGGGAGGPHGVGQVGGAGGASAVFGAGGGADNGWTGGQSAASGWGLNGTLWDSIHGCGGGGAGANSGTGSGGGRGGQYGGGGGGGFGAASGSGTAAGDGGASIIVITFSSYIKTQVFLFTPGVGSFPDPGNWYPPNTVECIGLGGNGGNGYSDGSKKGSGGGGGAYAKGTNMALAFPCPFIVGPNYVNFNSNSTFFVNSGNVVSAQSGANATSGNLGAPGNGGTQFYPAGYQGARGGDGTHDIQPYNGAGGGGAAGPLGGGNFGQSGSTGLGTSGVGGAANGGTIAGGALGTNGNTGTSWDATHGPGSGGGGGKTSTSTAAGNGGVYGGGGGGSYADGGTLYGTGGPGLIVLTYSTSPPPTQVFLLGGSQVDYSFPDPGNWNPLSNTVEIVASGSNGRGQSQGAFREGGVITPEDGVVTPLINSFYGGGGGGGGAYAVANNLAVSFPLTYTNPNPGVGTQTYAKFNSGNYTTPANGPNQVCAETARLFNSGYSGQGDYGGSYVYPAGFYGGAGGNALSQTTTQGAGGGGAGGPHGTGSKGVDSNATTAGNGGYGDGSTVAGGTAPGGAGASGIQWDATHGCGGGGGGGKSPTQGGNGGSYGAGGGGCFAGTSVTPGTAGPGLIIVTYQPVVILAGGNRAIIMM